MKVQFLWANKNGEFNNIHSHKFVNPSKVRVLPRIGEKLFMGDAQRYYNGVQRNPDQFDDLVVVDIIHRFGNTRSDSDAIEYEIYVVKSREVIGYEE